MHRTAEVVGFVVAMLGVLGPVQLDGLVTDGHDDDFSFDAVWQSDGRLTPDGYVVRFAIPFKSLRFPRTPTQHWGIALARHIRCNNEDSYWPYLTKRIAGFVPQFATLQGLTDISPGRNLQAIPYGTFAGARFLDTEVPAFRTVNDRRVGLDARRADHLDRTAGVPEAELPAAVLGARFAAADEGAGARILALAQLAPRLSAHFVARVALGRPDHRGNAHAARQLGELLHSLGLYLGVGIVRQPVGEQRQRRAGRRVLGVLLGGLVPHVDAGVSARQPRHPRERPGVLQMAQRLHRLVLQVGAGVVQHHTLEHVRRAVGLAHLTERRHRLAAHVEGGVVMRDVQQHRERAAVVQLSQLLHRLVLDVVVAIGARDLRQHLQRHGMRGRAAHGLDRLPTEVFVRMGTGDVDQGRQGVAAPQFPQGVDGIFLDVRVGIVVRNGEQGRHRLMVTPAAQGPDEVVSGARRGNGAGGRGVPGER